jgi:hypothetical protein
MEKLHAQQPKVQQSPQKITPELDETMKKVKDLLAAQQTTASPKKLKMAYQAPQLVEQPLMFNTPSYQLQEPVIGTEPLLSNYQRIAPLATPQPQMFFNG